MATSSMKRLEIRLKSRLFVGGRKKIYKVTLSLYWDTKIVVFKLINSHGPFGTLTLGPVFLEEVERIITKHLKCYFSAFLTEWQM